jgi:PEP-CTERM motif
VFPVAMKTRIKPETALKSSRPTGWAWRLGLLAGAAAAASAFVVLIGNAYTLELPQITAGKDKPAAPAPELASQGRAHGFIAWNSGRSSPVPAAASARYPSAPHGGQLLPAVATTLQAIQDDVRASAEASDDNDGAAPELTPVDFPIDGARQAGVSDDDGALFGFGAAGSDGFGPPSGGGGFLSNPGASTGGAGASPADSDPQGLQPLLAAPGLTGPVPEPATWALLTFGLAGVGAALRSQRRQRSA